jgi:hypothetical protein
MSGLDLVVDLDTSSPDVEAHDGIADGAVKAKATERVSLGGAIHALGADHGAGHRRIARP